MLMIYSASGICSKMAAGEGFLSFKFCLFYGAIIALLGFYAIAFSYPSSSLTMSAESNFLAKKQVTLYRPAPGTI